MYVIENIHDDSAYIKVFVDTIAFIYVVSNKPYNGSYFAILNYITRNKDIGRLTNTMMEYDIGFRCDFREYEINTHFECLKNK